MKELHQVFEDVFGYLGALLEEDLLPEPLSLLYQLPVIYISSALSPAITKTGGPYPFFAKFIFNNSFNASAYDADPGGLVCIHSSVPLLLYNACMQFASKCNVYTALPMENDGQLVLFEKPTLIPGRLALASEQIEDLIQLYDEIQSSITLSGIEEETFQYGLFLYESAIRFVVMHECMHIILGHTTYARKSFGIKLFMEVSEERESHLPHHIGQVLEFLADRNTAAGVVAQALEGNTFHTYGQELPSSLQIDRQTFLTRSVVNAICILFHLFPYNLKFPLNNTVVRTHPHPYVRMQWINRAIGSITGKDAFTEAVVRPFGYTMATLARNFTTPNSWLMANSENFQDESVAFSDKSYEQVSLLAKELQAQLWTHAPVYNNTNE